MSKDTTKAKSYAVIKPCGCLLDVTTFVPGEDDKGRLAKLVAMWIKQGELPQLYDYSDLKGRGFSCEKCK